MNFLIFAGYLDLKTFPWDPGNLHSTAAAAAANTAYKRRCSQRLVDANTGCNPSAHFRHQRVQHWRVQRAQRVELS